MKLISFDEISSVSHISYKILNQPSEKVSLKEASEIISLLEKELDIINNTKKNGIGLAAPQLGIKKQVAIIRIGSFKLDLVNPIILDQKNKIVLQEEGCLSFPGLVKRTARYNEIIVQSDIAPYKFMATNLISYACQHEIDHLNGLTIFDRAL